MKSRDRKDLHTKTVVELKKLLKDAQKMLFSLQFENNQARLKDTQSLFWKRKEIAMIKTILKGKEKTS